MLSKITSPVPGRGVGDEVAVGVRVGAGVAVALGAAVRVGVVLGCMVGSGVGEAGMCV